MGIVSSMSPRLAWADGDLWVSSYDEAGRRCWMNNKTGEMAYRFFEGKPVDPKLPHSVYAAPVVDPHTGPYGAQMVPHQAGDRMDNPQVAPPPSERKSRFNSQQYYIRPTYKPGSWMWK